VEGITVLRVAGSPREMKALAEAAGASHDGCPHVFVLRDMMEGAGSVDEALSLLRRSRRTTANSILVADAGGAAVAETSHERMAVRRPEDHRRFATNDFRSGGEVRCDRYDRLVELTAAAKAPLGVKDLERLLDAVDLEGINVQSMIFLPAHRELRLAFGRVPAANGPFVRFRPWE